jgi:hypothetical protein
MSQASASRRLSMTEGQLYSAVITLVVAVLLLFGLGDLHGVASNAVAASPLPLTPQAPGTVVVPSPGSTAVALPPLPVVGVAPVPAPQPEPLPSYEEVLPAPHPTTSPAPSATPTPSTCRLDGLQGVDDTAIDTLATANGLAGGRLPTSDIAAAIGVVTGCDPADPAVIAVGLLIGIGHALPDPGLPNPVVLPFVQIPDPVVAAVQPARPLIDQACGLVGTGQTVASLFVSAYPQPVPQLTTQVLFTALSVCGQVRRP